MKAASPRKMAILAGGAKQRRSCELCDAGAAVYCEADGAFLCRSCDARVHGANFLVARHVRWVACADCHSLDPDRLLAGAGSPTVRSICRSCDPAADGGVLSTSCSGLSSAASATSDSGVSTAESGPTRGKEAISGGSGGGSCRRRAEAKGEEGVLVNWSRRLGGGRRWAEVAARVVRTCPGGMAGLPPRVGLSAAVWFAMKRCGGGRVVRSGEAGALRKLEACSGVPATVIVAAESRLARVGRKVGSMEEGWGEWSPSS